MGHFLYGTLPRVSFLWGWGVGFTLTWINFLRRFIVAGGHFLWGVHPLRVTFVGITFPGGQFLWDYFPAGQFLWECFPLGSMALVASHPLPGEKGPREGLYYGDREGGYFTTSCLTLSTHWIARCRDICRLFTLKAVCVRGLVMRGREGRVVSCQRLLL